MEFKLSSIRKSFLILTSLLILVEGHPSNDKDHPDYVPSVFSSKPKEQSAKRKATVLYEARKEKRLRHEQQVNTANENCVTQLDVSPDVTEDQELLGVAETTADSNRILTSNNALQLQVNERPVCDLLYVNNNGPAILDSNITFFAKLNGEWDDSTFKFIFEDDTEQSRRKEIVTTALNCTYNVTYSDDKYDSGNYTMKVVVYIKVLTKWEEKASGKTVFLLTDQINGNITTYKNGHLYSNFYYPSCEPITINFTIYDPNGYFKNAKISYIWLIDDHTEATKSTFKHNFTHPGEYTVLLFISAFIPNLVKTKMGLFNKIFNVRDQIPGLNVTGNMVLQHGDLLNLNISCNGSSPFYYCMAIQNDPHYNFTCPTLIKYQDCQFRVLYYLPDIGNYYLYLYVANDISHLYRKMDIIIYDVSRVPQLSVIILPIVSVVLSIVIITAGIAYYFYQHQRVPIEVADFDFTQSEEQIERTFFEHIRDTIKNALLYRRLSASNRISQNSYHSANYGSINIEEDSSQRRDSNSSSEALL